MVPKSTNQIRTQLQSGANIGQLTIKTLVISLHRWNSLPSDIRTCRILPTSQTYLTLVLTWRHQATLHPRTLGHHTNVALLLLLLLLQATISLPSTVAWPPAVSHAQCRPLSLHPQPVCARRPSTHAARPSPVRLRKSRPWQIHWWIIIYSLLLGCIACIAEMRHIAWSVYWTHECIGKGFPYSLLSIGPRADPGVQAVSLQATISHSPGGRLPLLPGRPVVTFPAAQHHCPLASTKLYCLVTEVHRCKQLAQGCYAAFAPSSIWTHDLLIASPHGFNVQKLIEMPFGGLSLVVAKIHILDACQDQTNPSTATRGDKSTMWPFAKLFQNLLRHQLIL